ncbi:MAG: SLBB domain-containing protein [bacterium]
MKQKKNHILTWALAGAAVLLTACAHHSGKLVDQDPPSKQETVPYKIAALDCVTLKYADGSENTLTVASDSGALSLDGESVKAIGLSPDALLDAIKKKDSKVRSLKVSAFMPNRVTVLGEVFHQLYAQLPEGPMRVLDAIAAANGFTPMANPRRVKLIRRNADHVQTYDLDLRETVRGSLPQHNMLLESGDVIVVPRNFL